MPRLRAKKWVVRMKNVPRRLKPGFLARDYGTGEPVPLSKTGAPYGTAEAVPFRKVEALTALRLRSGQALKPCP